MTDEEALILAEALLKMDIPDEVTGTWESIMELCLWVKDVSKRLPKPRLSKTEYMREYMRLRRAKMKLAKKLATSYVEIDGTHKQAEN